MNDAQVLSLAPRTLKGRNVVARHGRVWTVAEERERVLFSGERHWLLLVSCRNGSLRWVRKDGDPDFDIS